MDNAEKFCGLSEGYEDYPYVYWPDISSTESIQEHHVCSKNCPKKDEIADCIVTETTPTCSSPTDYKYSTEAYLGRYCLPDLNTS